MGRLWPPSFTRLTMYATPFPSLATAPMPNAPSPGPSAFLLRRRGWCVRAGWLCGAAHDHIAGQAFLVDA